MTFDSSSASEDERAFLQRRVASFGLVAAACYLFFLAFRALSALAFGFFHLLWEPSMAYHLLGGLCFLGIWVICRRGQLSVQAVRRVETVGLLLGVVFACMMGTAIPLLERPDLVLVLALSYALVARAVFVPSSARRSLFIALAIGVELVLTTYYTFYGEQALRLLAPYIPDGVLLTQHDVAIRAATAAGAWWVLPTFITAATSRVIYGLRRQVRDARRLGQYQLERKLGEGGMGVVYRAKHAMLQRPTAVKLLHPERAGKENLMRFEKEVQETARLRHSNVITIFDYGHTADGLFYYAMEYLDGVTLDEAVRRSGPMPTGRVVHILRQMTAALVEAHGMGLIHRDIKPANVMLFLPHRYGGVEEGVKVLDFGLVKVVEEGGIDLTNANTISGTPQYMAPEAIRDPTQVDGRSDLYALAAVGYYIWTGEHVFGGKTVVEVCGHHLHSQPVAPSERLGRELPERLEQLILRCLSKEPDERPQSAGELERLLRECTVEELWDADSALSWWEAHGKSDRTESDAPTAPVPLTVEVERDARFARARGEEHKA